MPNGGMPVFTLIATGWRYRKIFFYKKSTVLRYVVALENCSDESHSLKRVVGFWFPDLKKKHDTKYFKVSLHNVHYFGTLMEKFTWFDPLDVTGCVNVYVVVLRSRWCLIKVSWTCSPLVRWGRSWQDERCISLVFGRQHMNALLRHLNELSVHDHYHGVSTAVCLSTVLSFLLEMYGKVKQQVCVE